MQSHPSMSELVEAVKLFIDETAAPGLTGHGKFHARVASNVLAIVLRELEQANAAETAEASGLMNLLGTEDNSVDTLRRDLCDRISSGTVSKDTPGLIEHLKTTAIAQLKIDQPRYSGLKSTTEITE